MVNMNPTIVKTDSKNKEFVINNNISIKNGQYGKWEDHKDTRVFVAKGAAIILEEVYIDVDSLERTFILTFKGANGDTVRIPFPRKNLTEQGIMELLAQGAQVNKVSAGIAIASIFNQEPNVPCKMIHERLGFWEYNQKRVFLGSKGIGVESQYRGELQIKPSGDFETWKEMCIKEVLGTPMEFVLAVAATAPVLDYFQKELHIGNIIVSLVGESTTGKTTAGCLGVSVGSKCSFQGDSMVATFADSQNSLMHSIHSSYPMLIDEGSLIRQNPTNLIYELSEGKEKGRLTKELKKAESMTFSTVILTTSEKSIIRLCDENTGVLIRCIEIEGVTWTKSAESADIIKKTCEGNYGFLVSRIARRLLNAEDEGRKEELLTQYDEHRKKIILRAKEGNRYNPLTERFAKTAAIICLGVDMVSKILKVDLDMEMILRMLEEYSAVSDRDKMDIGERAMDYLCQYITIHTADFVRSREGSSEITGNPQKCKGRIHSIRTKYLANEVTATKEVFLPEIILEEILKEGGFPDKKVVLKRWKASQYLHCETDRYVSKVQIIKQPSVKGYRIYIPEKNIGKEGMEKIKECLAEDTKDDVKDSLNDDNREEI